MVSSAAGYIAIVALLRLLGSPSLARMSGYDIVATVTFGAIVAAVPLMPAVSLSEGLAALVTFLALQQVLRWLQARWLWFHGTVRERPRVLLWDGVLLEDRLTDSSVSADEVRAAVRKAGFASLADVQAVVLENDGEWSVIPRAKEPTDFSAVTGLPIPGWIQRDGTRAPPSRAASPTRVP